jgi:hypothetical protein
MPRERRGPEQLQNVHPGLRGFDGVRDALNAVEMREELALLQQHRWRIAPLNPACLRAARGERLRLVLPTGRWRHMDLGSARGGQVLLRSEGRQFRTWSSLAEL